MMIANEVRKKARQFGFVLSDDELEHILWEHTGYPCFWPRRDAVAEPAKAALRLLRRTQGAA